MEVGSQFNIAWMDVTFLESSGHEGPPVNKYWRRVRFQYGKIKKSGKNPDNFLVLVSELDK